MPFNPQTESDIQQMLSAINIDTVDVLFDEIPDELRNSKMSNIPPGLNEMAVTRLMQKRAQQDGTPLCFAGAGAFEHHIPAAVWQLATRGEYYTAYTPYQAEASQGTLQLIYEYQTMMAKLMAMDVSNASLYDGASGLAESALMAVRANKKSKSRRILVPRSIHPAYRKVLHTIVSNQQIELVEVDFDHGLGTTPLNQLDRFSETDITALIIPQPNFFGCLEDVNTLTNWAHQHNALVIGVVNPIAMALLSPPGDWGELGADIVCGEGQPLGVPLSSGGPYFGFMCCRQKIIRQMPGRIVGRTLDLEGKEGFTLTLQAREQHIRRAKATSNICTNQGLLVTAATIHMALLGYEGLRRVAMACHQNTQLLIKKLEQLDPLTVLFKSPFFHEIVVQTRISADRIIKVLAKHNIVAGVALDADYPELGNSILICATETKTQDDIEQYVDAIRQALDDAS